MHTLPLRTIPSVHITAPPTHITISPCPGAGTFAPVAPTPHGPRPLTQEGQLPTATTHDPHASHAVGQSTRFSSPRNPSPESPYAVQGRHSSPLQRNCGGHPPAVPLERTQGHAWHRGTSSSEHRGPQGGGGHHFLLQGECPNTSASAPSLSLQGPGKRPDPPLGLCPRPCPSPDSETRPGAFQGVGTWYTPGVWGPPSGLRGDRAPGGSSNGSKGGAGAGGAFLRALRCTEPPGDRPMAGQAMQAQGGASSGLRGVQSTWRVIQR